MRTFLSCRGLCKAFGGVRVVDMIDLDVAEGSLTAILGPSGCGKTTLLRLIAGFERQDSGTIVLDGVELRDQPPEQRTVNTVFQSYALFPHMTVRENVAFPITLRSTIKQQIHTKVDALLDMVRLTDLADRYPKALSGGQQQRVAVARALAAEPYLLLLDEPLSALDRNMRQHVQMELKALQKRLKLTFVLVTHDQDEALALADDIIVMSQGKIVQRGSPEQIYRYPASRFVADFIGGANVVPGRIVDATARSATIRTGLGDVSADAATLFSLGEEAILVVRPEALVVDAGGPIRARVRDAAFQGTHWLASMSAGDLELRVRCDGLPAADTEVGLKIRPGLGWITKA